MAASSGKNGSTTLLEERFASADSRFLDELLRIHSPKYLATFADKWKKDPRPWARQQILTYLALPLDRPGHEPIVKRRFKHAESVRDDEVMAAFLVAFDRLVRRQIRKKWQYNWQTRESWQEEVLQTPRDRVRPGAWGMVGRGHLFSYRTRYYLRRRVWRYFRRMGYQRPDEYVPAVARAMKQYRDEDVTRGENLLDSWSLLQICFRHHSALQFGAATVALRDDRSLGELDPAPRFPELWRRPAALETLLELASTADCRLIRVWAMGLMRKEHGETLRQFEPARLLALLEHEDGEVQRFAAELLGGLSSLQRLPVETWLRLLEVKNPEAVSLLCDAMARHVAPDRLSTEQCIQLACAAPAPVARLGFGFAKQREFTIPENRALLKTLAEARCGAIAGEVAAWALEFIGTPNSYDREAVTAFFDASLSQTRAAALDWLKAESPGWEDPQLWARLVETPYDDVRLRLVDLLDKRVALPGMNGGQMAPLWCTVVLGVHRGGRQKQKVVHQLALEIAKRPERAGELTPILAVAVRSIRGPERRAGLAAVATLVEQRPELQSAMSDALPELKWRDPVEASA